MEDVMLSLMALDPTPWPTAATIKTAIRGAHPTDVAVIVALADARARASLTLKDVGTTDAVVWVTRARRAYDYVREVRGVAAAVTTVATMEDPSALVHGAFVVMVGASPEGLEALIRAAANNDKLATDMIALQLHRLECVQLASAAVFRTNLKARVAEADETYSDACFGPMLSYLAEACGGLYWSVVLGPSLHDVAVTTLCLEYMRMRGRRLFDIVREFPESRPAIEEMRRCMEHLSASDCEAMRLFLAQQIRAQYGARLLHAGARTHDILEVHVTTMWLVSTLRLARSCVAPVVTYLATRKDGLEVVVRCLMNPEEVGTVPKQAPPPRATGNVALDSDDDDGGIDVVKTLLASFGVEAVVGQYRKMLRDTLLVSPFADFDRETKAVETLKATLGDEAMQFCSVMINDVSASKRFNVVMNDSGSKPPPVSALVVSKTCWPVIHADPVAVHPSLAAALDGYLAVYKRQKPNRTLHWHTLHGTVELTVGSGPVARDVTLSFVQASVVMYVAEAPRPLPALADLLKVALPKLEVMLQPITPSLVVRGADGVISLQTRYPTEKTAVALVANVVPASPFFEGLTEEEVKVVENSVMAMLKAAGATKTLTQIENTLRMFGQLKGTVHNMKGVLTAMVTQEKLILKDGTTYSLKR